MKHPDWRLQGKTSSKGSRVGQVIHSGMIRDKSIADAAPCHPAVGGLYHTLFYTGDSAGGGFANFLAA